MKGLIFLFLFLTPCIGFSQQFHTGHIWVETAVSGKITKDLDWGVDLNSRFDVDGLSTFFPQASLKYKVTKWFRPSIEYRMIMNREINRTYSFAHRINANLEFRHSFDRLKLKSRLRYQYRVENLFMDEEDTDFDTALRLKLEAAYDFNGFKLTPVVSSEIFYDPKFGPYGRCFNKSRTFLGFDSDLDSAHGFSFGYILDYKFNTKRTGIRHILSLGYSYEIGYKSKDKKKGSKDKL